MMECFALSVIGGIAAGMPIGVAGALVADSALTRQKRRLILTMLAASLGDGVLSILAAFLSQELSEWIQRYEFFLALVMGVVFFILGLILLRAAYHHTQSEEFTPETLAQKGLLRYLLHHTGPALMAFLVTFLHPSSFAFIIWVASWIQQLNGHDTFNPWVFSMGIWTGSLIIFSISSVFFWKIGQSACKLVYIMRFALAALVVLAGVVCFAKLILSLT